MSKKKNKHKSKNKFAEFIIKYKAWIFPLIVLVMLVVGTVTSISGTSVGVYDKLLEYKPDQNNLILGEPRTVRSDEWLVNTPFIVSQSRNNFPLINKDVANGQDMSVVIDVPYRHWSIFFKPQNWAFFIMSLEHAFAFKWWFISAAMLLSAYYFVLLLLPGRFLEASLLAIFMVMNPFIQWWYQSTTILSVAYTLALVVLAWKIVECSSPKIRIAYSASLTYILVAFGLILYPPFQIICGLTGFGIFVALLLSRKSIVDTKTVIKRLVYVVLAFLLACIIAGIFIHDRSSAISAVQNTIYPGKRTVTPGTMPFSEALAWPINYINSYSASISYFGANQSEVSSVPIFGILVLPFLCFITYTYRKKKYSSKKLFNYLLAVCVILLILIALKAFVPFGGDIYKIFFLNSTLPQRLWAGVAIINLVLIILSLMVPIDLVKLTKYKKLILYGAIFAVSFIALIISLLYVQSFYSLQQVGKYETFLICSYISLVLTFLTYPSQRVRRVGIIMLVSYSAFMSLSINPLYKGVGALTNSTVTKTIQNISANNPESRWISTRNTLAPLILAGGAPSMSSVEVYPQKDIWNKYFPNNSSIYNRYSHIKYKISDGSTVRSLVLLQADKVQLNLNSCDAFFANEKIDYILDFESSNLKCFSAVHTEKIGNYTYQILKRKK